MICADFLAGGANIETGDPSALMLSLDRLCGLPPLPLQQEFLSKVNGTA
jgi:hypothetical protein